MNMKIVTLCAAAVALAGCGSNIDSSDNSKGTVSIIGTPLQGNTLAATVGDADGLPSTIRYQWLADGRAIDGANASTFTLGEEQIGDAISVAVSYTDNGGVLENVLSNETDDVLKLIIPSPGSISITGDPLVTLTLTAVITDENGVPDSVTYTWMADGTPITGASEATFRITDDQLGTVITVMAVYTDEEGFDESVTSEATAEVTAPAVNIDATLNILDSDKIAVGTAVVADLADPNGTSSATNFVWMADGVAIAGATASSYSPVDTDLGKTLSVSITFQDDDGFDESVNAEALGIVHSMVAESMAELVTAANMASEGQVIGIASGDYSNIADPLDANEIDISANGVTLQLTQGSDAVLSGAICLQLSGDDIVVDGLSFADVDVLPDSVCTSGSTSQSIVSLNGSNITFMNNTIDSQSEDIDLGARMYWLAVRGVGNTITRNSFSDENGFRAIVRGSIISIFADDELGYKDHVISYNLFKDIGFPGSDPGAPGSRNGNTMAIEVGRSSGTDSQEVLNIRVENNLFKNVNVDRRLIRVQSSGNTISGNTILDSSGMIALEDGNNTTVSNNVIIAAGDNNDDGGISFAPYGHTISNNYIAGLRTTSGDRAGLYANSDTIRNSGNASSTPMIVTVMNNSLFNSREALEFGSRDCEADDPVDSRILLLVDFDNNLVANGEEGDNLGLTSNGSGRTGIQDDCDADPMSDFDGTHIYSSSLAKNGDGFFNAFAGSGDTKANVIGDEGAADISQGDNGLWQGQNADVGVGADISILTILTEQDVGPGSADVTPME